METDTQQPVMLRGVNRSGLEYSSPEGMGSLHKAGITADQFDDIALRWGANIVRLPFNQSWALRKDSYNPESYLTAIDTAIELASARGSYTMLDLQWIDAAKPRGRNADGSLNFVPALPDSGSIEVWTQLSRRYRDEPGVLFDIFNEPHDRLPDDDSELNGMAPDGSLFPLVQRRVTMKEWQPWAAHMIRAIRSESPPALIFVSGINWGYDLRGHPLPGVEGVVYSTHVYPNKGKDWDRAFGDLSGMLPVFVGELGGVEADFGWGERLLQYLNERSIGWAAWSWCDHPHLVHAGAAPNKPTAFGHLIFSELQRNRT